MTRQTKYILLGVLGVGLAGGALILCVAVIVGIGLIAGGTSDARSERTSETRQKAYKPAEMDELIEFHEWTANVEFTKNQRVKFENLMDARFERDAAETRKEMDGLREVFDKIKSEDKDTQELTRTLLSGAYIEDFKRKKDEPYSRFMLGVYEKTGDDSAEETDADADEKSADVSGTIAPELVGKWRRSEGSGYVDPTGKTKYKSGAYYDYEFAPDGTVKYSMDKDVLSVTQCKITETKSAEGKATTDGGTLVMSLGEMNHTSGNSCEESENFEKTLPAETLKRQWRMQTEYEVTKLCIEEENGEQCYDKNEG